MRYAFSASADKKQVELDIFDDISASMWRENVVSAKSVRAQLKAAKGADLTLRINSRGGDVIEGLAIFNQIKAHDGRVTAHVTGIAASMASVIAMAADEVVMPKSAFIMIHNPFGCAFGDAEEMRSVADTLQAMQDTLLSAYAEKTGLPKDEIQAMMDKETYLSGPKALKLGFADRLEKQSRAKAEARYLASLDGLDNVPDEVRKSVLGADCAIVPGDEVDVDIVDDLEEEDGMKLEEMEALLGKVLAPVVARLDKLEKPESKETPVPAAQAPDLAFELARDSAFDAAVSAGKIPNTDADRARFVARAKDVASLDVLVKHYEAAAPVVSTAAAQLGTPPAREEGAPRFSEAQGKLAKKFGWNAEEIFKEKV